MQHVAFFGSSEPAQTSHDYKISFLLCNDNITYNQNQLSTSADHRRFYRSPLWLAFAALTEVILDIL
jgi:hypothetical protein